eukprot:gene21805-biopygen4165
MGLGPHPVARAR